MVWTSLNELREKYLSFFESKGHLRLPGFSLVPKDDKSLLLINAGMAPLKKYFTGELKPPRNRLTTCQKCVRTPDIERVGKTSRHGTFFEMLGNFSFGDYFKHEAIAWAWEFCTTVLDLPVEKLYASVYFEDDEAFTIWQNETGILPGHIVRLGKEDNFWELGAGPCGPSSEIYFDRGERYGCGSPDCAVGCDCDRFVEFWNLVFTQYQSDGNGQYSDLRNRNIDTGMGLERLACIMQGVDNLFEVDTIRSITDELCRMAGIQHTPDEKSGVSLRIVTDHIRSATFLVADGVMPSNEARGYVVRRLIRRAARHGRLLGIEKPFLFELCGTVIAQSGDAYPELIKNREMIAKVIENEEIHFGKTLGQGLQLFEKYAAKIQHGTMSGSDAFVLSDTYGFPLDLTKELLAEKGMTLDESEYAELAQQQRERARNARKNSDGEGWKRPTDHSTGLTATVFRGYETLELAAKVEAILLDGQMTSSVKGPISAEIVLDQTPFYPLGGGQAGDRGTLQISGCDLPVSTTRKTAVGTILHFVEIGVDCEVQTGDPVRAVVDAQSRDAVKRNHTAAHLLHAALKKVLGPHAAQAGQLVEPDLFRFDFTHFAALTTDEIEALELEVNQAVFSAVPVSVKEMKTSDAIASGATALFEEKYGETVRVVQAGNFSSELCSGTHCTNTGNIGLFKIISESSVAAGIRRIEALTGWNALALLRKNAALLASAAEALKLSEPSQINNKIGSLLADLKDKQRENEALAAKLSEGSLNEIRQNAKTVGGVMLYKGVIENASAEQLRALCDKLKAQSEVAVAVVAGTSAEKQNFSIAVACAEQAVKLGASAGRIAKAAAAAAGGSGGGRDDSAMAGAKDIAKIKQALDSVDDILLEMLK
ncbi:MAG TPA: alanine--tRNA ligase [Clostridiales bacterium]|nr:alanine--tRNA ligase [Clostridiales bacterium]